MQVEAGVPDQPVLDRRGLVGGVVVQDEVQVQALRDGGVDELEEPQELLVAMVPDFTGSGKSEVLFFAYGSAHDPQCAWWLT